MNIARERCEGATVASHYPTWQTAGAFVGVGLAALFLYAFWPSLADQPAAPDATEEGALPLAVPRVGVIVAERSDFPLIAEATGHLAPWRRTDISSEAQGVVTDRLVEEGALVEAGAVLLKLDDREARIELAEAEAELVKARAGYAVQSWTGSLELDRDTTRLARARSELRDAKAAHARGLISLEELADTQRRFDVAEVLTGRNRDDVQAAIAGLAQAEQRLNRARLTLQRTEVRAPFTGRVANLAVEVGQRIGAGENLLTLMDDRRMKVEVTVVESDLSRLSRGSIAWVDVPALGKMHLRGSTFSINPDVDPTTGTGRVTVSVGNPDRRLVAGLYANVKMETLRLHDRIVVPIEAVLTRQGRELVFCVEQDRTQWTYVTTGARSGDRIELLDGVSPGDTIIVTGHFALAHNAPVQVDL